MSDERIKEVARRLWIDVYEDEFRGKLRGKFIITRDQLKEALGVSRLHKVTIIKLQDYALEKGLVIIDLDDVFPCIELKVVRKYRKVTSSVFEEHLSHFDIEPEEKEDEEIDDEDDDEE